MPKCVFCSIELHAANWYHDANICSGCGINIEIDAVLSFPPSRKDENEAKRLNLLKVILG